MSNKLRHGNRVQIKRSIFAAKVCDKYGLGTIEANVGGPVILGEIFVRWDNGQTSWALATWLEKVNPSESYSDRSHRISKSIGKVDQTNGQHDIGCDTCNTKDGCLCT